MKLEHEKNKKAVEELKKRRANGEKGLMVRNGHVVVWQPQINTSIVLTSHNSAVQQSSSRWLSNSIIANVDLNLSFSIKKYKSLSVFYTNADQFVNKRDLLLVQIANKNPDLILISELLQNFQVLPFIQLCLHFQDTLHILISMQIVSYLI